MTTTILIMIGLILGVIFVPYTVGTLMDRIGWNLVNSDDTFFEIYYDGWVGLIAIGIIGLFGFGLWNIAIGLNEIWF